MCRGYIDHRCQHLIVNFAVIFCGTKYVLKLSSPRAESARAVTEREREVTYLYISGKVTIPKQSEFNVNSYNKDTVNFVNANVLI